MNKVQFWYRDRSDVPNFFGFMDRGRSWQMDCDYDIKTKVRSPFYTVSVLGKDRKMKEVGAVPVDAVTFDPEMKEWLDTSFLDNFKIED
jgi:hypothetical protein